MSEAALQRVPDDIDDVPRQGNIHVDAGDLKDMDESDWVLLKNELQEYLHRIEHTEDPAYESASIFGWLDANGEYFDRFYQHLRNTNPELLLRFRKDAFDENELNDADFIRAWTAFRDVQQKIQGETLGIDS